MADAIREAAVKEYYSEQRSKNKLAEDDEKGEDVNVVTEIENAGEVSSPRGRSIDGYSWQRTESNQVGQHEKEGGRNGRRKEPDCSNKGGTVQ